MAAWLESLKTEMEERARSHIIDRRSLCQQNGTRLVWRMEARYSHNRLRPELTPHNMLMGITRATTDCPLLPPPIIRKALGPSLIPVLWLEP